MCRMLSLFLFAGLLIMGCAGGGHTPLRVESPYREPQTLEKGQILHVSTGRLLTKLELIDHLAHYPVVYVGESHDSVDDHAVQLEILKSLENRFPGQMVLGLEMLRRPSQAKVDAFIRGEITEKAFVRVWRRDWGGGFRYYREILLYAREKGIPVLALNAAQDLRAAVSKKGLEDLEPAMSGRLPEIDLSDSYHRALISNIFKGHTKVSDHVEAFYRTQVLWDETMAQTASAYLNSPEGQGKRLMIFAGGYHVLYGFGIPRRLFRRVPVPYVIVVPYAKEIPERKRQKVLMQVEVPELPLRPADIYWAVGYEDLEDQRVSLGVRIEQASEGVRVIEVIPNSSAAKAGIAAGDVIVAMDESAIQETFDLVYELERRKPGDRGEIVVVRDGQKVTLPYEAQRHVE